MWCSDGSWWKRGCQSFGVNLKQQFMSRANGSESISKLSFSAIRGSQCRFPLVRKVGILLLTVVNKIGKEKLYFFLATQKFLTSMLFYILYSSMLDA